MAIFPRQSRCYPYPLHRQHLIKLTLIAKNTVLIQTGDIADRGEDSIEIYQLFLRLRNEAISHNSLIINILGNHETLDMTNSFTYTSKAEIAKYGGEDEWKKIWSLDNEIGHWLRNAPVVLLVHDTIFCHAGLRSITLKALDGEGIGKGSVCW